MADFVSEILPHDFKQIQLLAAAREHDTQQSQKKNPFAEKNHRPVG
jgi:hypothetical protein